MTSHIKRHMLCGKEAPTCYILRIDAGQGSPFWLYAGVDRHDTLGTLDAFLQEMWLRCCDHQRWFAIRGAERLRTDTPLYDILRDNKMEFRYQYDSTVLRLGVVGLSERIPIEVDTDDLIPTEHAVSVLAIHDKVDFLCQNCGKPSMTVCAGFMMNGEGILCRYCAHALGFDEDMMRPAVQSPRTGQCRYGMAPQ